MFSQFRQDWFLFHNYFAPRAAGLPSAFSGRPGVYVDVGANHGRVLSNTAFFDGCMGWQGVCVEPNPVYVGTYGGKTGRTCKLLRNCVWKERRTLWLDLPGTSSKGTAGRILNCTGGGDDEAGCEGDKGIGAKVRVPCITLDDALAEAAALSGHGVVDLLSIDVEGAEIDVLEAAAAARVWDKYNVSVVVIEANKLPQNKLHAIMVAAGFAKEASVGVDDVFARRAVPYRLPGDWGTIGPYIQRYHA